MCFILKEKKPRLFFAVNFNFDFNCTSIDFLGLVQFIELSVFLQIFNGNRCQIHKANRLCPAQFLANSHIVIISLLQKLVLELCVVDNRQKCCVTAMIRPICVYHTDFRKGGVSVLRLKVVLTEFNIVLIHCKTVVVNKFCKLRFVISVKAVKSFNRCRNGIINLECFKLIKCSLSCFNRVYNIFLNLVNITL